MEERFVAARGVKSEVNDLIKKPYPAMVAGCGFFAAEACPSTTTWDELAFRPPLIMKNTRISNTRVALSLFSLTRLNPRVYIETVSSPCRY